MGWWKWTRARWLEWWRGEGRPVGLYVAAYHDDRDPDPDEWESVEMPALVWPDGGETTRDGWRIDYTGNGIPISLGEDKERRKEHLRRGCWVRRDMRGVSPRDMPLIWQQYNSYDQDPVPVGLSPTGKSITCEGYYWTNSLLRQRPGCTLPSTGEDFFRFPGGELTAEEIEA